MSSARRMVLVLAVGVAVLLVVAGLLWVLWPHFEHAPGHGRGMVGVSAPDRVWIMGGSVSWFGC